MQPKGLQQTSTQRAQSTLDRVEQALTHLDEEQRRIPRDERRYPTSAILTKVAELHPDLPPIHRSTLRRNLPVKELITKWRAHTMVSKLQLDLARFAAWRGHHRFHPARYSNRLRSYSVAELAERVVGLEDLQSHCIARREQIERALLPDGSWPHPLPYPIEPFRVSDDAQQRYQSYLNNMSKAMLIRRLLELERAVQEHQAHMAEYDRQYVERGIQLSE